MRTRAGATAGLAVAVIAAGCGGDDSHRSELRPPVPINVSAAIDGDRVRVSPASFGAGPVVFIVSNQSPAPQTLTFETDELGGDPGGMRRSTREIAPRATATLEVATRQGAYTLATGSEAIRPAAIEVSEPRPSAQDELLLP